MKIKKKLARKTKIVYKHYSEKEFWNQNKAEYKMFEIAC